MPDPNDEFLKKLLVTFRLEAEEHLDAISSGLRLLEKAAGSERTAVIEQVFREAHSLKGAARAVNLADIETICHSLETLFAGWKNDRIPFVPAQFDTVHQSVDRIRQLLSPVPHRTPAAAANVGPASTVRIDTEKLDSIMRQAEELLGPRMTSAQRVVDVRQIRATLKQWKAQRQSLRSAAQARTSTAGLLQSLEAEEAFVRTLDDRLARLERSAAAESRTFAGIVDGLLHDVRQTQMLPFSSQLEGYRRLVRDLAREQGKQVEIVVHGGDIEIDRRILEEMKAPFHHLLRNCIDHGIETPGARERKQKPPQGTITITVSATDSRVNLSVADDGIGIDLDRVRAAAASLGFTAEKATGGNDREAFSLIFQSGLSTSPAVSSVSGRGLGLAIVREKVERLGGTVSVETRAEAGTTIRIELPLTLATFRGILVRAAGQHFIVPAASVERVARVAQTEIRTVENRETISLDGRPVSLVWLSDVLEMARPAAEPSAFMQVAVLSGSAGRIAFIVDAVVSEQEVLVKNLGPQLERVRNVSGASVLGTGEVVPVLNIPDLMIGAVGARTSAAMASPSPASPPARRSILVVEDSITSRTLLKNILETAGYEVAVAVDGIDAWTALKSQTFDLVVSDVEMPRMDGFDLTEKVRSDETLADLPVVLVTALASPEHRERGIDAGANAYIVKSSFDQSNLLEVVRRLI